MLYSGTHFRAVDDATIATIAEVIGVDPIVAHRASLSRQAIIPGATEANDAVVTQGGSPAPGPFDRPSSFMMIAATLIGLIAAAAFLLARFTSSGGRGPSAPRATETRFSEAAAQRDRLNRL